MPINFKLSEFINLNKFFGKKQKKNINSFEDTFNEHNDKWKEEQKSFENSSIEEKRSLLLKQQEMLSNLFKSFNIPSELHSNYTLPIFYDSFNNILDNHIVVNDKIIENNIKNDESGCLQESDNKSISVNKIIEKFSKGDVKELEMEDEKNSIIEKLDNYVNEKVIPYSYGFDDCM
ncbi:Hypothetical protein SRAE_2000528400 [Strongyloides ratti]|uniref:Uncharacterized protein n=1 Tax=Strongyloides ratti TaxID=34506 RepID=A0A090LST3_STRRB|nr:Hypothetical protein SRAE_2000528400 [Strongyloides ratti]CEF70659.1 Hypothetical protein SRAE_2000528400 [Strongyloides ratti]